MQHNEYRPKNGAILFFHSFGVDSLKNLTLQDDQKVVENILLKNINIKEISFILYHLLGASLIFVILQTLGGGRPYTGPRHCSLWYFSNLLLPQFA